jgi:hypothetical protein
MDSTTDGAGKSVGRQLESSDTDVDDVGRSDALQTRRCGDGAAGVVGSPLQTTD